MTYDVTGIVKQYYTPHILTPNPYIQVYERLNAGWRPGGRGAASAAAWARHPRHHCVRRCRARLPLPRRYDSHQARWCCLLWCPRYR